MNKFTPATIYKKLGENPTERQILLKAAEMLREKPVKAKNNILALKFCIDIVRIACETGRFCSIFENCFNE